MCKRNVLTDTSKFSEFFFDEEIKEDDKKTILKIEKMKVLYLRSQQHLKSLKYDCAFCDLDGHRRNVLFMYFTKLK